MPRHMEKMPDFNGVAAGQTATVQLPNSGIYHQVRLQYQTTTAGGATQANMEAEIDEMRVKINGKVQRTLSGAQLFAINAYHGIPVLAGSASIRGVLPLYFSEPWRRSAAGEDAGAWGMADVDTFQIEVDINSGATSPQLGLTAVRDRGSRVMGLITKYRRHTINVGATGWIDVPTFPKHDAYWAVHCVSTDIDEVDVIVEGDAYYKNILIPDLHDYTEHQGFAAQTGYTHIEFAATTRAHDSLPLRSQDGLAFSDFRVDFNMGAATPFTAITETLGLRD